MSFRTAEDFRRIFQPIVKDLSVPTAGSDQTQNPWQAGKTGRTIYVQKVTAYVRTAPAAGETLTVQDDEGTPIIVVRVLGSTTAQSAEYVLLDSAEGIPLTEGADLDLAHAGGTAFVGRLHLEGYMKPTGVIDINDL